MNDKQTINPSDEYQIRIERLKKIREKGINPYPAQSERTHMINEVLADFKTLEKKKTDIFLCGRLRSIRSHGNLSFTQLQDDSGMMQLAFSKKEMDPEHYKEFVKLIDIGDFLQVQGIPFVTHKGEESLMIKDWKLLTKTLRPLPEKFHGLKDEEERLRYFS